MPTSIAEGKSWIVPRVIAELPGTVLDLGAGEGTYARLLADHREGSTLIAVEGHKPYVEEFGLESLYDKLIVGDVRTRRLPAADVVILGDIIEHLGYKDAEKVWNKARKAARKTVLVSIPLGSHPQGAVNGNDLEVHRSEWSDERIHELGGVVASWTGSVIGCYAVLPA